MSMVAKALPAARYGSVAELSAYAGLSAKTIRRLIDAGKIRGLRVGRRVLIPFEDLDRHILRMADRRPRTQEAPTMAIAPTPNRSGACPVSDLADEQGLIPTFPPRQFDENGRLVPLSAEERRARAEAARRTLAALRTITDETDTAERWAEVYRNIDAGRPDRPLFEGMY